jgi:hypothetical protein
MRVTRNTDAPAKRRTNMKYHFSMVDTFSNLVAFHRERIRAARNAALPGTWLCDLDPGQRISL